MPMPQRPNTDDPAALDEWAWQVSNWFESEQGLDEFFSSPGLRVVEGPLPEWLDELPDRSGRQAETACGTAASGGDAGAQ